MELWIRSQDRMKLIPIDKPLEIFEEERKRDLPDDFIPAVPISKTYSIIGIKYCGENIASYKTKERALEVLDEIQKFINNNGIENEEYDEISGCYYASRKTIYEMPKE